MKVTVDVGVLLFELEQKNSNLDLTGVKAYLLDAVLQGGVVESAPPVTAQAKKSTMIFGDAVASEETPKVAEKPKLKASPYEGRVAIPLAKPDATVEEKDDGAAFDLEADTSPASKSKRAAARNTVTSSSSASQKRIEEMSNEELFSHLTGKQKANAQGQFVDGPGQFSDDLEF